MSNKTNLKAAGAAGYRVIGTASGNGKVTARLRGGKLVGKCKVSTRSGRPEDPKITLSFGSSMTGCLRGVSRVTVGQGCKPLFRAYQIAKTAEVRGFDHSSGCTKLYTFGGRRLLANVSIERPLEGEVRVRSNLTKPDIAGGGKHYKDYTLKKGENRTKLTPKKRGNPHNPHRSHVRANVAMVTPKGIFQFAHLKNGWYLRFSPISSPKITQRFGLIANGGITGATRPKGTCS